MNYLTVLFSFQMYGCILADFKILFLNSLWAAWFWIFGCFQDVFCNPWCMWPIKKILCVWNKYVVCICGSLGIYVYVHVKWYFYVFSSSWFFESLICLLTRCELQFLPLIMDISTSYSCVNFFFVCVEAILGDVCGLRTISLPRELLLLSLKMAFFIPTKTFCLKTYFV